MSEFLVHMVVHLSPTIDADELREMFTAEAQRARELSAAGRLKRLWRIPGQQANWGIWQAEDATQLHEHLSSLPLWPRMTVTVHPLAIHPNDPATTSGAEW